jgi:hypothetical protein
MRHANCADTPMMPAKWLLRHLRLLTLCCALPLVVHAQPATVDWFSVDAGGGASSSAQYRIASTIGQADAYLASSAQNDFLGGFWALDGAVPAPTPRLNISMASPNVLITWPSPATGFALQENSAINDTNGWQNVLQAPSDNGGTRSVSLPLPAGPRFFRLRKP